MRPIKIISSFLIIMVLWTCTTDQVKTDNELELLLKIEKYLESTSLKTQELYYNGNNLLAKYLIINDNYNSIEYDIRYEGNQIISIVETVEYFVANRVGTTLVFHVTYEGNQITLSPEDNNSIATRKIVIDTTNGFINSSRIYFGENFESYLEKIFFRSSENNIERVEQYEKNQSTGGMLEQGVTYNFSNYENTTYSYNFQNELFNLDSEINWFCTILNLKISEQNPGKRLETYEDVEYGFLNVTFEYNVNKKPTKAIYEDGYYGSTDIYTYY